MSLSTSSGGAYTSSMTANKRKRLSGNYKAHCNQLNIRNSDSTQRTKDYKAKKYSPSSSHSSFDTENSDDKDNEIGHIQFQINDIYKDRYVCKSELGLGTFGKVFKCKDLKHDDYIALKVIRKIEKYVESAEIERDILNDIYEEQKRQRKNYCVKLYSSFKLDGHFFMVFETLGMSLLSLMKLNDYVGIPLTIVKSISQQILQGIDFLHSMNLIHTDLKLENILFKSINNKEQLTPITIYNHRKKKNVTIYVPNLNSCDIKLIDFGGATYDNEHKTTIINTRQYRGPEVTLEVGWSFPSDIWSIGCIIAEILDGELLFATHDNLEHLALMERLIDFFPKDLVELSPDKLKYFTEHSCYIKFHQLSIDSQEFVKKQYKSIESWLKGNCNISEENPFTCLLKGLLRIDPLDRYSAKKALKSSFFA